MLGLVKNIPKSVQSDGSDFCIQDFPNIFREVSSLRQRMFGYHMLPCPKESPKHGNSHVRFETDVSVFPECCSPDTLIQISQRSADVQALYQNFNYNSNEGSNHKKFFDCLSLDLDFTTKSRVFQNLFLRTACEESLHRLCGGNLDGQRPDLGEVLQACQHGVQEGLV